MTAKEYRAVLGSLRLTQAAAARLLGVNEVTSRRWARYGVGGTAEIVLRLLATGKITQQDVSASR